VSQRHARAYIRGGLAIAERIRSSGTAVAMAHPARALPTLPGSPGVGAKWSLTLFGFLLYLLVITSYRLPLGEAAIIMSLGGIAFQRGGIRFPPYLGWFVAFAGWSLLVTTQTEYPDWAMPELIGLIKLCLIVFAAANAVQTPKQVRLFMVFFLACFALFPLRGAMSNYFIYHNDMQGRIIWNRLYGNPNDLGAMALLQLSMATALLAAEPKGWVRWSAMAGVIALPMLILLTQSRGVFLGLSVFIVIVFFGQRRRVRLALRLAVVAAILASITPSSVWTRLETLKSATDTSTLDDVDGAEGSARQRYEIWRVAFRMIGDHPIMGVGFGAYKPNHEQYAMRPEFNPTAKGARDTHSLYFNVLAETGFPGLVLYLGMVGVVLLAAERARRRCKHVLEIPAKQLLVLEAGLLSFLVASIFGSLPYLPHFLIHLVLIYAVSTLCNAQAAKIGTNFATGHTAGRRGGTRLKMSESALNRRRSGARPA
jgi:probable O-glycosylation ligase (exosortase A-associated)